MKKPRILVVEDNEDNAVICCTALEHYGFEAVRAADGGAGLRLAREVSPDLIILDLSLPGMSGWEVAERLRADGGTRAIPIVVWSANDAASDRARADGLGCAGYLAKPCELRPLLREVERALVSAAPPAAEARRRVGLEPLRLLGIAIAATLSLVAVSLRVRCRAGRRRRLLASAPLPAFAVGAA